MRENNMRAAAASRKQGDATAAREERKCVAGVRVALSWPASADAAAAPRGVTFLLPGANIKLSEYDGLRDVLVGRRQLVVGLHVNVLWPLVDNHRKKARDVKRIFEALVKMYPHLPTAYSVVGHSAGGKIALLVASVVDPERVAAVLALDPVDLNPVEFSNAKGSNLPLGDGFDSDGDGSVGPLGMFSGDGREDIVHVVTRCSADAGESATRAPIVLTCTDGGRGIPQEHNAAAIHKLHPRTRYYRHAHAGHLAYCDNGGGFASLLVPDVGTREGNVKAKEAAHELIREIVG